MCSSDVLLGGQVREGWKGAAAVGALGIARAHTPHTPHTPCRYDRLHYLVTTRRDHGISFKSALSMPQAEFEEMYPGYRKWWAAKGR